jgi:hypothetical protein
MIADLGNLRTRLRHSTGSGTSAPSPWETARIRVTTLRLVTTPQIMRQC